MASAILPSKSAAAPEVGQDCLGGKGYARIRALPTLKERVSLSLFSAKQMANNHLWVVEEKEGEDEVMPHWRCSDWD